MTFRNALITVLLAALAGGLGVWIGGRFLNAHPASPSLHDMVHRQLSLSHAQETQVAALEQDFAARRQLLEAGMRRANTDLAHAIEANETMGPKVADAVRQVHEAMMALQTATIEHVFAMRAVLTPEQRVQFDKKVVEALTATNE
ncbi:MAG: periplasmic heavy metal sensor [Alphaproteobacteria bacterium]|nr:periplasmic heavy metal sensor [Alphaproteobacteria bacterium]